MKAISLTLICLSMLFPCLSKAQDPKQNTTSPFNYDLYSKSKWIYDLRTNLSYTHFNNFSNDVKYSETNNFRLSLGATYMFSKGLGAGLTASYRSSGTDATTDFKTRDWSLGAHFTYGRSLSDRVFWYVEPGVSYGQSKDITTNFSGGTVEDKTTDLGFTLTTGFPIHLNGAVYLDPHLCYQRDCDDYDDGEDSRNSFGFGVSLLAGLTCGEKICDSRVGYRQSNMRFNQGSSYISYYTRGVYNFGNIVSQYNNQPDEIKSNFSMGHLNIDYAYFPINNLYVGLGLSTKIDISKPGLQPDYTFTNSEWQLLFNAGYHIPVTPPVRNFSLGFSYGIGQEKNKTDDNGNVNEFKEKTSYYGANLTYDAFFGDNISVSPQLMYGVYKAEQKDATNPPVNKEKGLGFRVGVRYFLD